MPFKKNLFLFIFFISASIPAISQNFEWLRTIKSKNSGTTYLECSSGMANGGSAIIFPIDNYTNSAYPDTFLLDTFKFSLPNIYGRKNYLSIIYSNSKAV